MKRPNIDDYPLKIDGKLHYYNTDLKKYIDFIEAENKQLRLHVVVSSFLDNLKASDSQALLEMRERNQEEFVKWCAENPHAGVDDEWQNEIMFMRDVAKYIEDLVV